MSLLRRYTPPSGLPVPKRRLDIFRDEEDFTGTEYYQAVGRHLQGSRKLIVICSPNARASSFVNDEIQRFTQVHAAEDLIPILIAGNPEMTNSANNADMAFPAALCERLELPLASDYRGFDPKSSKLHSARYRTSWYSCSPISATAVVQKSRGARAGGNSDGEYNGAGPSP